MNVKIKGINDYLYFELNETVGFNLITEELKGILDALPGSKHGYYPKAFFDLKGRILSQNEMLDLLHILYQTKKVLFGGIKQTPSTRLIKLIEKDIYNGEVIEVNDQDVLIIGNLHIGSIVRCNRNIYIIGKVEGLIEGLSKSSSISISQAKHARIRIFNHYLQDVTIFTLSLFYYKNDQIHQMNQRYINQTIRG